MTVNNLSLDTKKIILPDLDITRSEIHSRIWSNSIKLTALALNLKPAVLSRACDLFDIPKPTSSYWVHVGMGKLAPVTKLSGSHDVIIRFKNGSLSDDLERRAASKAALVFANQQKAKHKGETLREWARLRETERASKVEARRIRKESQDHERATHLQQKRQADEQRLFEIIRLKSAGHSLADIAKLLNLSQETVGKSVDRAFWQILNHSENADVASQIMNPRPRTQSWTTIDAHHRIHSEIRQHPEIAVRYSAAAVDVDRAWTRAAWMETVVAVLKAQNEELNDHDRNEFAKYRKRW